jgi:hypothetical protein
MPEFFLERQCDFLEIAQEKGVPLGFLYDTALFLIDTTYCSPGFDSANTIQVSTPVALVSPLAPDGARIAELSISGTPAPPGYNLGHSPALAMLSSSTDSDFEASLEQAFSYALAVGESLSNFHIRWYIQRPPEMTGHEYALNGASAGAAYAAALLSLVNELSHHVHG